MFELPWEQAEVKVVIETFGCKVIQIMAAPEPERRAVIWQDDQENVVRTDMLTLREAESLAEQVDQYDIGHIISTDWWGP